MADQPADGNNTQQGGDDTQQDGNQGGGQEVVVRAWYNPVTVAVTGTDSRRFVQVVDRVEEDNTKWLTVRLTARGNEGLRELCHTETQREVWRFPCYEFTVREGALSIRQVRTARPSYVNAILIASRGVQMRVACNHNQQTVFRDAVRLPGYWGGSCAACKWRDHASRCMFASRNEPKFMPTTLAALPRSILEDLED